MAPPKGIASLNSINPRVKNAMEALKMGRSQYPCSA